MPFEKNLLVNGNEINLVWNDNEQNAIENFSMYATTLLEIVRRKKNDFRTNMNMSAKVDEPVNFMIQLPSKDDRSILLHNLRPFILQKEQTFLPKICNFLAREIDDDMFQKFITQQKNCFFIKKNAQTFHLTTDQNKIINSDEVLTLWLNAYEYHRDDEKIKELQNLTSFLPYEVFEFLMLNALLDKTKVIFEILNITTNILNSKITQINISNTTKEA
ncbi:hypothetical protein [Sulfurovum sp.]|uniref:hypothetical protein n=1 Tax=Sulfurovum sp. TaxID=1969726 RepID=UPI0035693780